MIEVLRYFREKEFKTYIVTGGGQDFVRTYAERVYGIPPQNVIGSALDLHYEYDKEGQGVLMRPPKLLLNNNLSGKPEDIYLFLRRHPKAAFGNSTGDQQMEEFTQAGGGATLMMMVLHDDAQRGMHMVQRGGCRIPRLAPSRKPSMMKPTRRGGM
jgi:hypothetical protein